MAPPNLSDVHVSQPLSNLSVMFRNRPEKFVCDKVSPNVPVNKQSNTYFKYSKADFLRDDAELRAPGAGYARLSAGISTDNYSCKMYAAEYKMPDEIRANYDSPLGADRHAVEKLTQSLLIHRERLFVTNFIKASTWLKDVTGHASTVSSTSHVFWDNASADIINTIWSNCDEIEAATGYRPNRFMVPPSVERVMMNDPDIIDRHKHTNDGPIDLKAVAALCGIGSEGNPGEIVVLRAVYNSAVEGAAASMGFMLDDRALLAYVAPSPQLDEPSAVYTFSWSEFDFVKNGAAAVSQYREEQTRSDIYRAEMNFDQKIVASDCGMYFSNLLT